MRYLSAIALCLLAACNGGGGSGESLSRSAQAAQLATDLESENISDPGTLPDSGVATYSGFMTAGLPTGGNGGRVDFLGDLSMTVDFGATKNQVTGRADNFTNKNGRVMDGRLRIRGGDLFRDVDPDDNYTFTGNVDGTLTRNGNAYVIDAEIEGEFRGRRQNGVSGLLFGDVTGPLGQDIFDGDFVAAKD